MLTAGLPHLVSAVWPPARPVRGRGDVGEGDQHVSSGVVAAEVAESKGGRVRLSARDELDPEWDPTEDRRLTVWELTQHLVARQGRSDAQAGALLARAGPGFGRCCP